MAELVVRNRFLSAKRQLILKSLKLTFPAWGIAAPIASAVYGVLFVAQVVAMYFTHTVVDALSAPDKTLMSCAAMLFVFITGMLLVNWLTRDRFDLDKDGVQLPFSPWRSRQYLLWNDIVKIAITPANSSEWQKKSLVFFDDKARQYKVELSHMEPDQIEQVVLAIQTWHGASSVDPEIDGLKNEVAKASGKALTYTNMWEDELARRFAPTAFIPLAPGQMVRHGTLQVVRHLALGGLSAVYLCQMDGHKLVVLKEAVVSDDSNDVARAKALEMLEREAAFLIKLSHPQIVKVMDHFVEDGRNYVLLDYIQGQDLRQYVNQNGPVREEQAIDWTLQMVSILKYLHEQSPAILHRDFTPDNLVLAADGSIFLIDFGAANEFIGTATGTFVGKHAFIAPEQFRGKAVTQSDIYALGCTLFFLLTGKEPEALSESDPAIFNANLSKDICEVVQFCTKMDLSDRYQSVARIQPILKQISASLTNAA